MLIAEELALPLERVRVAQADTRPELLFSQLTGASNTTIATCLRRRPPVTGAGLDGLRNICHCETYCRVQEPVKAGAENM